MDKEQLLELKDQIEETKTEVSQLEGKEKHLMEQLEKDWGCTDVEKAEVKVENMDEKIKKLQKSIDDGIEELEEKYEFDGLAK